MKAKEVNLNEIRAQFTENHWRKCGSLLEATLEAIQSSAQARQALKDLVHAGCNPAVVLHEIALHFGGGGEFWDKRVEHGKGQLKAITARLTSDADILERIVSEFMEEDADLYQGAIHSPLSLRQEAESLKVALATLKKYTHGKTVATKHLVYLSYHVKAATNRAHYAEIARLYKGLLGDSSLNIRRLAESLRRQIQRHEKQHPKLFREEKVEIQRNFAAWREWSSSRGITGH
jgi:hypothetical protein